MLAGAGEAMQRLTIHLREPDRAGHHSLAVELLARAHRLKLLGATAFEASEGEGRAGPLHQQHLLRNDAPLAIVIVDRAARIEEYLAAAAEELDRCVVLVQDVVALRL